MQRCLDGLELIAYTEELQIEKENDQVDMLREKREKLNVSPTISRGRIVWSSLDPFRRVALRQNDPLVNEAAICSNNRQTEETMKLDFLFRVTRLGFDTSWPCYYQQLSAV